MRGGSIYMRPDWVILGADNREEGVVIIASTDLTEAELRVILHEPPIWPPNLGVPFRPDERYFELETKMGTYVWVRGDTYEEALGNLFRQWQPKRAAHPKVGPQPALPAGQP